MPLVKSFSVNNGDMFYIKHGSSNFTIIDCHLDQENEERIIKELKDQWKKKDIIRFISTHPDEDHILGLKKLDETKKIVNFYCVKNKATKSDESDSFKHYCKLRDGENAYYIKKGCSRKWMNDSGLDKDGTEIGSSGINILWPEITNADFKEELNCCSDGGNANNISPIIKYSIKDGANILWFGDLETTFMEKIKDEVKWPKADIIFAPHHGRCSGTIPEDILEKIEPKLIIIGEAKSEDLDYYSGYNTITQNSSKDITLDCNDSEIDIYCSNCNYTVDYLDDYGKTKFDNYIGTLTIKEMSLV